MLAFVRSPLFALILLLVRFLPTLSNLSLRPLSSSTIQRLSRLKLSKVDLSLYQAEADRSIGKL